MKNQPGRPADRRLDSAAKVSRIPPARLRYFVSVGLLRPSRFEGRVPFFDDAGLARLRRIRRLRDDLGLNMAGIEVVLRLLDEIESLRAALGSEPGASRTSRARRVGPTPPAETERGPDGRL
jgi:MerR family transcriptional regulator/heat shock protein HspR